MASSPEMEPPGFEIPGPPPPPLPSESPPCLVDSFNSTSPDAAPPGFDKPNAWMVVSETDTSDLSPSQTKPSSELQSHETNPIGNGNGDGDGDAIYECREAGSIREEMLNQQMQMPGPGGHVSEMPEPEVVVPIEHQTVDPFQPESGVSGTKTLDTTLLELPEIVTPTNCQTVGPLEAHSSPVKVEIHDPAMPPSDSSEQTLIGDGLGEKHRLCEVFHQSEAPSEEQNYRPVPKPETAPLPTVQISQLAVHESVSESLGLSPSPPPVPLLCEAIVPESGCESLNPLPALTVSDMPKSMAMESKYDNLKQNTCDKDPTGDEIPTVFETITPLQLPLAPQGLGILEPAILQPPPQPASPPPQFKSESGISSVSGTTEMKFDNHKMLQPVEQETLDPPNQEMETFSLPHRDGIADMFSSETGSHVNQITNEPPLKKSRNMHEMQGQLTPEACRSEIEKDRLVSETCAMSPHREEDMEALQIDMDMSEDETLDRSPTYMGPPGTDTKESDSLEEAPPGYDTICSNSQTGMISQDALSGGSLISII